MADLVSKLRSNDNLPNQCAPLCEFLKSTPNQSVAPSPSLTPPVIAYRTVATPPKMTEPSTVALKNATTPFSRVASLLFHPTLGGPTPHLLLAPSIPKSLPEEGIPSVAPALIADRRAIIPNSKDVNHLVQSFKDNHAISQPLRAFTFFDPPAPPSFAEPSKPVEDLVSVNANGREPASAQSPVEEFASEIPTSEQASVATIEEGLSPTTIIEPQDSDPKTAPVEENVASTSDEPVAPVLSMTSQVEEEPVVTDSGTANVLPEETPSSGPIALAGFTPSTPPALLGSTMCMYPGVLVIVPDGVIVASAGSVYLSANTQPEGGSGYQYNEVSESLAQQSITLNIGVDNGNNNADTASSVPRLIAGAYVLTSPASDFENPYSSPTAFKVNRSGISLFYPNYTTALGLSLSGNQGAASAAAAATHSFRNSLSTVVSDAQTFVASMQGNWATEGSASKDSEFANSKHDQGRNEENNVSASLAFAV